MKKRFLFITCEEAKHICDKSQYGEATPWERFKLTIRLSWCKITRAYTSRNRKLTQAMENSEVNCLESQEKSQLKNVFEQELKKVQ